ncbi:GSCOCG00013598001-RA-CDS, partial [Cotesia congregata]
WRRAKVNTPLVASLRHQNSDRCPGEREDRENHNFVDANERTLPGNFFRRIGDWQHARGDAWDRKAHIWHIFDKSDEPQETPIGNLKREFGDKTYKFADKVDGLAEQGKKIFGQVVGSFITKIQNKGKQPAPAAPTEGPTTSVSTNSNANARPAPTAPTSFTASAQPPTIESMFNPENIPLPSGFNPAPPPRRNPLPPTSDPIIPTGGPYFPTNYNPGSPPTGGPYFPTNYNPGSPPTGGPY